jgi:hypothetical protein
MAESPLEALVGSMSIAELSQRSGKSVGQIVDWALGTRGNLGRRPGNSGATAAAAPAPAKRGRPANNASGGSGGKSVNVRTPAGREAYTQAVLEAVQNSKSPIGAGALRKKVGGTALQVRTALNKLKETRQIKSEGRARARRYTAK